MLRDSFEAKIDIDLYGQQEQTVYLYVVSLNLDAARCLTIYPNLLDNGRTSYGASWMFIWNVLTSFPFYLL